MKTEMDRLSKANEAFKAALELHASDPKQVNHAIGLPSGLLTMLDEYILSVITDRETSLLQNCRGNIEQQFKLRNDELYENLSLKLTRVIAAVKKIQQDKQNGIV